MARTWFVLAAGAVGVAATMMSSKESPPALSTAKASPPAAAAPKSSFGDAEVRKDLELAARRVVDGRVEVPLDGGRRAILTLEPALQRHAEALLEEADAPVAAIVVMSVDEGVAPDTKVCYHGGVRSVEASNLRDDERLDGTCNSLAFGLARSQNAILAKLATRHLDKQKLNEYAGLFGYDGQVGKVALPDDELELARAAAGFWHSELSPLGGALVANTIASGGRAVTPRLVASVVGKDGDERAILPKSPVRVLAEETAQKVGDMLVGTCETGTARKAFFDAKGRRYLGDVKVAGKTGSLSRKKPFLDYSWFVGYAPADAPEVVVSVLLGNQPSYRFKAHTVARLLLEQALSAP